MRHHFVRSLAGSRDSNFKNVTLLLHGDGTNGAQNNTFLDSSASNNAITRTGNVAQGSFSPYGDRWSNYFDGTGDYLNAPDNAAFAFGTGDFTIEYWIYAVSFANSPTIIDTRSNTTSVNGFSDYFNATGNYLLFIGNATIYTSTSIVSRNVWTHIAVSRSGTSLRVFINGVQDGSTVTNSTNLSNQKFLIGSNINLSASYANAYISNVRAVKGTAVYTSNFSVPTSPLSAIANTSILTCQSNRFRDASSNNFTITRTGDVSVHRFSPFGPDTLYRTDRIGGSAYFDGSGDWLQVANRGLKLTAGFFTAECWVYITAYSGSFSALFDDRYWQGGHNGGWLVYINSTGQIVMQASNGNWNNWGGTFITSSNSVIRGQWNHVAIVRGSNDLINIYINGISTTTPVAKKDLNLNSGSGQSAWESRIGVNASDIIYGGSYNYVFTGIISDLRVINGKCLYTANFSPPTEPLTAIPETTFLGRFANGSIVDNAMMHNIETVADAQIDTAQKKFGTGALEFDGNGDYLNFRTGGNLLLGTGDFTVELWFYARASRTHRLFSLDGSGPSSYYAGLRIDLNGSGSFGLYSSNGGSHNIITDQGSWSVNTWTHLAITRSGNDFRFFKNGTQFYTVNSTHGLMNGTSHTIGMLASYGADWFDGLIDDFRVTRGVARYTSNFTPPTAPFPDF